mmetsp:Transcript_17494/g.52859  ORF Transcript_17494/g.52859 Transcript_17494/m.52859 type:complete len:326 (-) Transcript_17494:195-1172(-)
MDACIRAKASFVHCPCCIGKLSSKRKNNVTFNSTGCPGNRITYPRSQALGRVLDAESFDDLARAADFAAGPASKTTAHPVGDLSGADGIAAMHPGSPEPVSRLGVSRRLAKLWLEQDRLLWARDLGYTCEICCMISARTSPKHHILFGWPKNASPASEIVESLMRTPEHNDHGCDCAAMIAQGALLLATLSPTVVAADIQVGHEHAAEFPRGDASATDESISKPIVGLASSAKGQLLAAAEYTEQELQEARLLVEEAICQPEGRAVVAKSSRRRRLIHWTAEEMGLEHWSDRSASKQAKSVWVRQPQHVRQAHGEIRETMHASNV